MVIGPWPRVFQITIFRAAAAFGVAGAAHAIGMLLLARQLPAVEFAYVALFLAFLDFGGLVGTGGADTIVVRHKLNPTTALLSRVLASAAIVALLIYVAASTWYGLTNALALTIALATIAAACSRVAGSVWQSRHRFKPALIQIQSSHVVLALLGVVALILGWKSALLVCALHAAYLASISTIGWRGLLRAHSSISSVEPFPWRESVPILFLMTGVQLAMQVERFLIPQLLRLEDLATYGVLAAVVGSPFQMLSIAITYTLMPRLKSADSSSERSRVLRNEFVFVIPMIAAGIILAWLLGPWVADLFVGDKFILTKPLIFAAILIGIGKVSNALLLAVVKALGATADLNWMNVITWIGLATSIVLAWQFSSWGLPGLLVGIACGWGIRAGFSVVLVRRVLRSAQA